MAETVEERLKRISDYVDSAINKGEHPLLNYSDLNWLIARAKLAETYWEYIDGQRKA